jgi:penicillin-binding protein 1C
MTRRAAMGIGGTAVMAMTAVTAAFLAYRDPPPDVSAASLPATLVITDRRGTPLREHRRRSGERCLPVSLDAMSPAIRCAMIAAEDKRFARHAGVDPVAVARAAVDNLGAGRVVSGASTLTWQLARMARPQPRTLVNKLREALWALRIERYTGKDDLLATYLNRVPFGGTLYGVEAAARAYFGKPASALDWAEASLLAGIPQAPARFRPDRRPERALHRREYVIGRLVACNPDLAATAPRMAEIPEIHFNSAPFLAPHFTGLIIATHPAPASGAPLRTTLDLPMQQAAESAAMPYAQRLGSAGIDGLAVVVLDVRSSAVRVMIGSPDYFAAGSGQINGALALRSPGSALKPFIYTEAFERGLLTPATLLSDAPAVYRDYTPSNFDRQFRGSVSAHDALAMSLNIPALELTRQIGLERVYNRMRDAGLGKTWLEADRYGLPLAIGVAGVTLLDLVNAYAVLAREGLYTGYRLVEDTPPDTPRRLWHAGAAYMTATILRDAAWQAGVTDVHADTQSAPFALKTGTSNGYRDAWAIAYNPEFVTGVWIGRADGAGHADLIGVQTAVPVCAAVFRTLYPAGMAGPWFTPPADVAVREVCAVSGRPPTMHCLRRHTADWLQGVSDARPCELCHAAVVLDTLRCTLNRPLNRPSYSDTLNPNRNRNHQLP